MTTKCGRIWPYVLSVFIGMSELQTKSAQKLEVWGGGMHKRYYRYATSLRGTRWLVKMKALSEAAAAIPNIVLRTRTAQLQYFIPTKGNVEYSAFHPS